jgi:HEAT repeat protein
MSNHDNRGRFTKGNKAAKKDWTKESAKKSIQEEISYLVELCLDRSVKEIRQMDLENESLLTHAIVKKALKSDTNDLKWAMEMIAGKAIQQVQQETKGTVQINIDGDDAKL